MKVFFKLLTPADYILFIIALLVISISFMPLMALNESKLWVQIDTEDGRYIYDLHKEASYSFKGPAGISHVRIEKGTVYFYDDTITKNKVGVKMGAISKAHQWIAQIPNKVFISIVGSEEQDEEALDASTF